MKPSCRIELLMEEINRIDMKSSDRDMLARQLRILLCDMHMIESQEIYLEGALAPNIDLLLGHEEKIKNP